MSWPVGRPRDQVPVDVVRWQVDVVDLHGTPEWPARPGGLRKTGLLRHFPLGSGFLDFFCQNPRNTKMGCVQSWREPVLSKKNMSSVPCKHAGSA